MPEKITTSKLLQYLFKTANIHSFMKRYDREMKEIPFSEYLARLCKEKKTIPAQVIRRARRALNVLSGISFLTAGGRLPVTRRFNFNFKQTE